MPPPTPAIRPMENYFNYFTEIEEYFWKKRGTALLVSTLDWALMDSWKQAQIPIEAVLKGIDRAFEQYEARRRKTRPGRQMINSLAYCHQAVLEAAADQERVTLQHPSEPAPFPREEVVRFLETNAAAVETAAGQFAARGRPESAATFHGIAASLRELATAANADRPVVLEEMERHLSVLEDKMHSTLLQGADERELLASREEMDRALAPVRRQMTADQIALVEKQFLQRKLLAAADLPRLSLFYL